MYKIIQRRLSEILHLIYTYRRALLDDSVLCDTTVLTRTLLSIELNRGNGKLEMAIDKFPLTLARYCRGVSLEGLRKT